MKKVLLALTAVVYLVACSSDSNNENNVTNINDNTKKYSQECFSVEDTTNPLPFKITGTLNDLIGDWKIVKRGYAFCDGTADLVEQKPFGDCNSYEYMEFDYNSNGLLLGATYNHYLRYDDNCVFSRQSVKYYHMLNTENGIICIKSTGKIGTQGGMYIVEFTPTKLSVIFKKRTIIHLYTPNLGGISTASVGDWEYLECEKVTIPKI